MGVDCCLAFLPTSVVSMDQLADTVCYKMNLGLIQQGSSDVLNFSLVVVVLRHLCCRFLAPLAERQLPGEIEEKQ